MGRKGGGLYGNTSSHLLQAQPGRWQPGESGSIQTQKAILTQYCQEHHMEIVDCYCDDGWSGTNFVEVR